MSRTKTWQSLLYALRPYQWVKNGFVLLPLVFGQKLTDAQAILHAAIAFIVFCAAASGVYLINDLADLATDRHHPVKKLRPLAQGHIQPRTALAAALVLISLSLAGAFALHFFLGICLLAYVTGNFLYTYALKHYVIVDVMAIGLFFLLRVIAGAVTVCVEISEWLLICAAILALFLGFTKRRHELMVTGRKAGEHRRVLEKYSVYFIDQMIGILTASTVIFYTLYAVDERTVQHFGTRGLIYTVPFVYYGIFRYLYLVHKRRQGGDPARILLKDRMMQLNILFWLLTAATVIYLLP